jgi:hypothetical protein
MTIVRYINREACISETVRETIFMVVVPTFNESALAGADVWRTLHDGL